MSPPRPCLSFHVRPWLACLAIAVAVLTVAVLVGRHRRATVAGRAGDEFRPSKSVVDEARGYGLKRGPNR
jgi:hypothetical protein